MTEDNVTPINERARLFASICVCQIHDGPDSTDLDQMEHDFDTWLQHVRAKAWDEGWDAAAYDLESVEHGIVPPSNLSTNPYRKETEE